MTWYRPQRRPKDVDVAKPEPTIIEIAMERAGVDADHAVYVGDAVWDVIACGRAGVPAIGLLSGGVSREELEKAGAEAVFDNPRDLCDHIDSTTIATLSTQCGRLAGRPGDGQPLDAVDEGGVQPVRLLRGGDVGQLSVQFLERDGDLAAGEVGAQAEMRAAAAESHMRVRVAAHVERPRIRRTSTRRGWPTRTTA